MLRPWNAAAERDDVLAVRVVARQLDGRLDALGAGVGQEDLPVVRAAGRHAREAVAQLGVTRVVKIRAADVDQRLRLLRDGGGDGGVAVPRRGRGHAGLTIEQHVAVRVFDHAAGGALHQERIAVDERGRLMAETARDGLLGDGARQGRLERDGLAGEGLVVGHGRTPEKAGAQVYQTRARGARCAPGGA
jgi:hypothetical protein